MFLFVSADLNIQVFSSSSTGELDKSITLNCSYNYNGDKYKVIWYKNMEQVQVDGQAITSGQYENEYNDENLNEHNAITNWLKIRSFKYKDSGVYQCFLRSTSIQQQQRFPVLSSITYNKPVSNIQSSELNKDQLFSNQVYLTIKGTVTYSVVLELINIEKV